jgi:hypothetical protein
MQQMPRAAGIISVNRPEKSIAISSMAESPNIEMTGVDLGRAIDRAKRTKLSPLNQDHLRELMQMGLVEMRDDVPALTDAGHQAIDR